MGVLMNYLVFIISLTSIQAQIFRPNVEYDFADFRPIDLSLADSRKARRIVLPEAKGRKTRYESELEFDDYEDDDRSYTVGARIKVEHPTPKYENFDESKATSFTKYEILHDSRPKKILLGKNFNRQKLVKKPIFKATRDFDSESEEISSEEFKSKSKKPKYYYPREFEEVASKGQIHQYIEDQQKLIDEVIQLRLLNDPHPGARAKYQQFLKAKDDERIEKEYEDELKRKPLALFKPNIEPRRRIPRKNQAKLTNINPPPLPRPKTLNYNRHSNGSPLSMTFLVDV